MRVAYLNMTEPGASCPTSLRQINTPAKLCGRRTAPGCSSVTYPVDGIRYSKVCGQARGYQYYTTDAFQSSTNDINSHFVDGLSIAIHIGTLIDILFGHMPLDSLMATIAIMIATVPVPSTPVPVILQLIISVNLESLVAIKTLGRSKHQGDDQPPPTNATCPQLILPGPPGPPGGLSYSEAKELKQDIKEELQETLVEWIERQAKAHDIFGHMPLEYLMITITMVITTVPVPRTLVPVLLPLLDWIISVNLESLVDGKTTIE